MNNEINITIINRGLDIEEKNITLFHPLNNLGNAVTFINNYTDKNYLTENIQVSKLEYYAEYLTSKNLALIKLDIKGSEGKAIEGGFDLISKYHVPFIFMELTPSYLKLKGTNPKHLLEIFETNGYKFSVIDFLSGQYCSIEQLISKTQINVYIVYIKIFE